MAPYGGLGQREGVTAALRILFAFPGGTGHFLPMVPVARAAEAAGHVVAFACQGAMVATVEEAGFTAFDAGGASLLAPGVRQPLLLPDAQEEDRAARIAKGAARDRERASAVLALCHQWRPDIVVCDEVDFGVVVAAERLGLPYATVQSTASGSVLPSGVVAEQANELRAEHGLPPDPGLEMLRRYLVLVPFPPSFRDPGSPLPPTAHALRHVSPDRPLEESALPWLAARSDSETGVRDAGDDLQPGVGRSLRAHCRGRARAARRRRCDRGPRRSTRRCSASSLPTSTSSVTSPRRSSCRIAAWSCRMAGLAA